MPVWLRMWGYKQTLPGRLRMSHGYSASCERRYVLCGDHGYLPTSRQALVLSTLVLVCDWTARRTAHIRTGSLVVTWGVPGSVAVALVVIETGVLDVL